MLIIVMISMLIYIIGFLAIYYKMPEIEKNKRIKMILVLAVIILLITIIVTSISEAKINGFQEKNVKIAKTAAVLLFAPVNTLILAPIAKNLNKLKEKKIDKTKFYNKTVIWIIVFIFCLMIEIDYIKNFMYGLLINK